MAANVVISLDGPGSIKSDFNSFKTNLFSDLEGISSAEKNDFIRQINNIENNILNDKDFENNIRKKVLLVQEINSVVSRVREFLQKSKGQDVSSNTKDNIVKINKNIQEEPKKEEPKKEEQKKEEPKKEEQKKDELKKEEPKKEEQKKDGRPLHEKILSGLGLAALGVGSVGSLLSQNKNDSAVAKELKDSMKRQEQLEKEMMGLDPNDPSKKTKEAQLTDELDYQTQLTRQKMLNEAANLYKKNQEEEERKKHDIGLNIGTMAKILSGNTKSTHSQRTAKNIVDSQLHRLNNWRG
jgi:hypothetical protein